MIEETVPSPRSAHKNATRAVALVGFMGAGKTSVGRELAHRLAWHFADLDDVIEKRTGRCVAQIFADGGEIAFRRLEYSALLETIQAFENHVLVLALGGGAFVQASVQECLHRAQIATVFLDASVTELFRRCEQPGVDRPLRREITQFRNLYELRRPEYLKATLHVNTENKFVTDVVEEIIAGLNLVSASGACE